MAGERILPGSLALTAFWNLGDNTWKPGMDDNLLKASSLSSLSVLSRTTSLPGSPTDGQIYLVPSGAGSNPNEVAIRDNGAWYYFVPTPGLIAHVQDTNVYWRWDAGAGAWIKLRADGDITIKEITGAYTMVQADFFGNVLIEANFALDANITVPPGLAKEQPVIIESVGTGVPTMVEGAGVTIQSADSALKIRTQFSTAILTPKGSDIYSLSGDIEL